MDKSLAKSDLPEVAQKKPAVFYGYTVLIIGLLMLTIMWGALYSYGVFFKPMSEEFGLVRAQTSGAYSLYMLLHGALYIVTGKLNDRFGPRLVLTACAIFLGAGLLLMSFANSLWQLYLLYGVLMGIGMSGTVVPVLSMVARWFTKRTELATGVASCGMGVGAMAIPPAAERLITASGWRFSYLIAGIVVLVVVTLLAQFLKRDPSQVGQRPYGEDSKVQTAPITKPKGVSFKEAVHSRQFVMVCIIASFFGFTVHTVMVHIVPYATDVGISPETAAGVLTAVGGFSLVGRVGLGAVASRIGKRPVFVINACLMLLAYLSAITAKDPWQFYMVAFFFGLSFGGVDTVLSPIVVDIFGLSSHGMLFGIVCFTSTLGGALGPLIAGYIFDVTGGYQLAFGIYAGVCVAGIALTILLKPARRRSVIKNV